MKKVLFGTSALVAAGLFAGQAVAAEPISLSIGGKQEQYFGGVGFHETGGGISDSFGIASDTELYFTGSTTLDNGITVRAVIQMEATLGTGAPDEQYVDLSGSFGRIRAGIKEGVFDSSAVEAPGVGEVSLADVTGWVGTTVNGTDPNGLDVTNTSDQASVSYFTPTFMGLQLGGSYIPDVAEANINDPGVLLTTGAENNEFQFSLNYDGEFSGVGIAANAAGLYRMDTAFGNEYIAWRAGTELSYAGFALGGAFTQYNGTNQSNATDGITWNVGATYEVGPYGVGIRYGNATTRGTARDGQNDVIHGIVFGAEYDLGPGITLVGDIFHSTVDADTAVTSIDRSGTGAVAGIALSF